MKVFRRFDKDVPNHELIVKGRANDSPTFGKDVLGKRAKNSAG
jgi:hypothetical protein